MRLCLNDKQVAALKAALLDSESYAPDAKNYHPLAEILNKETG